MKWLARTWIPIVIAVSAMAALTYATVQQNYRQSLNDPQVQIAEDAATAIAGGASIENVIWHEMPLQVATSSHTQIDVASSLAPWTAVYGADGLPLASTGVLNGALPNPPQSVFAAAQSNTGKDTNRAYENRITWQPQPGVRQALVIVYVPETKQFVASGRNMREVEYRENRMARTIAVGWFAAVLATLLWGIGGMLLSSRR